METPHLVRVREILAEPEHWTKGTFARNGSGRATNVTDPNATCFCLTGAFFKAQYELGTLLHFEAGKRDSYEEWGLLYACLPEPSLAWANPAISFNDNVVTTHEQVLAALDCAIEKGKDILAV